VPQHSAEVRGGEVNVVGYIKGKSTIQIARKFGGRERNFTDENFWARGYFVSTVGLDENSVGQLRDVNVRRRILIHAGVLP
jgi:REP element-mobilizing transposase RayT